MFDHERLSGFFQLKICLEFFYEKYYQAKDQNSDGKESLTGCSMSELELNITDLCLRYDRVNANP